MEHPIPPQLRLPQRTDPAATGCAHRCQAVLWLSHSGAALTEPSTDILTQEKPDKGLPEGSKRQRQQSDFEFKLQNTPGSCWQ